MAWGRSLVNAFNKCQNGVYLNEILFNLSINTKVLFMAFPKTLDNKYIHLPLIAATFNLVSPRPLRHLIKNSQSAAMFRYQDPLLFYQNPQCMQNNLLLPPPPHYSSHFLDESRICNPSQPCFMTKQTGAFTQPESAFNSSVASQLPFNYSTDPRTLLPTSSGKLSIPGEFHSSSTTFSVAFFYLLHFDRQFSTFLFSSANSLTT